MKGKFIHIFNVTILVFLILILHSCEVDLSNTIRATDSKIWVNAIVGVNDTVRIYIGNTSGLNSGDKAQYRNDAVVKLRVNQGLEKNLKYRIDPKSPYRGYYYTRRLENSAEGDTLRFISWIPDSDFDTVKGETIIPAPPLFSDPVLKSSYENGSILNSLDINLKDSSDIKGFYEINLRSLNYSDINSEMPTKVEDISLLNDLKLPYGLTWNEKLNSILIDYRDLETDSLHINFRVKNNYSKINLSFIIKKVTKEYYDYFKALDGGSVVNSNIVNGSGIFAGYSKYSKEIKIK